jgi:hypothetical protein
LRIICPVIDVWRFQYHSNTDIRHALTAARSKVEQEIASARSFSHFIARTTELYITYLKEAEPGVFHITSPCLWPKEDHETFLVVLQAALPNPAAQRVYARIMLTAKDSQGLAVFPAGRVDLLLGTRIATEIPEEHPARKLPSVIQYQAPTLFYEEPEAE